MHPSTHPRNPNLTNDSYFIIHNLAQNQDEVIRYSALLRAAESGWQAISYGLTSVTVFATIGGVYLNFALYAVAIIPAWLVIRQFGTSAVAGEEAGSQNDVSNSGEETEQVQVTEITKS